MNMWGWISRETSLMVTVLIKRQNFTSLTGTKKMLGKEFGCRKLDYSSQKPISSFSKFLLKMKNFEEKSSKKS